MPSKTPRQARFMAAVAHDPGFARKAGVPQSVGREFNEADADTGILKRSYRGPGRQGFSSKARTGKSRSYVGR